MIKGKTPEEIRETFNIKNDFAPAEEEQLRKENEWCEEPWSLWCKNELKSAAFFTAELKNMN